MRELTDVCRNGQRRATIYFIYCYPEEKWYIGKTVKTPEERLLEHFRDVYNPLLMHTRLAQAMSSYPRDAFDVTPICECPLRDAVAVETYWINQYCSLDPQYGYNMSQKPFSRNPRLPYSRIQTS